MTDTDPPTVLVVEDERDLADMFGEWLSDDYDVRVAYDGESALSLLDDDVEVALLDRLMDGLSGDEVLEEMEARGHGAQVAMITAVEPDLEILELGISDYLVKPVFADDLRATVKRLLARSSYDDRLQRYFSLVSKRSALEDYRSSSELDSSDEYGELTTEIESLEADLDDIVESFDEASFEAAFRSLDQSAVQNE